MSQSQNILKSADRAFKMVEHLKSGGSKTVTELSEELDMPKSTVQVYLNTLYQHRFVTKSEGRYRLGLRFLEYGISRLRDVMIYPEVRRKVEELAETTGELAASFVEEDGRAVYIYGVEGERSIRTDLAVGDQTALHCTASGKAIMAHLPDQQVDTVIHDEELERKTEHTITDPDELRTELQLIREQGYATSDEESVVGMRAVAAPIILDDRVRGSLSLAGPANRFVGARFDTEVPEAVTGSANELELRLMYDQSGV
jgi:DNA-binding IclR family transcriptional regulator